MGDADDFYTLETKRVEEEFLEKLKNGKTFQAVEKEYLKETKRVRDRYQKMLDKELNTKKKVQKKKIKKEKEKVFTVEKFNFEPTTWDKIKFKYETGTFKFKRKITIFFQKRAFDWVRLLYFKLKYLWKNIVQMYENVKEYLKTKLTEILKWTKESAKKLGSFIGRLLNKIKEKITKIFKKKEETKKDGNKKESASEEKESDTKEDASDTTSKEESKPTSESSNNSTSEPTKKSN